MDNRFRRDCVAHLAAEAAAGRIGRRDAVKAMAALLATPLALRATAAGAAADQLVLCNWGGDAMAAFAKAFGAPFTEATGIPVRIDGAGPTEGAIRGQHKSGKVAWDVVDTDLFTSRALGEDGILAPIDFAIVDKEKVRRRAFHEHGVAGYFFSHVLAYDTEAYGDKPPQGWADFFDTEGFPGKRAMYKWMVGGLEAALLADGVKPDALYPLDVDRALGTIEPVLPDIVFWDSGAESRRLLMEGEVQMAQVWNTRAIAMARETDGRIAYTYDGGLLGASSWAVIAGNPAGAETAMQFIAGAQDPEAQLALLKLLGNGPANPAASELVPDDLKEHDCTQPDNIVRQHLMDTAWYAAHYRPALERFLALGDG